MGHLQARYEAGLKSLQQNFVFEMTKLGYDAEISSFLFISDFLRLPSQLQLKRHNSALVVSREFLFEKRLHLQTINNKLIQKESFLIGIITYRNSKFRSQLHDNDQADVEFRLCYDKISYICSIVHLLDSNLVFLTTVVLLAMFVPFSIKFQKLLAANLL